ncbi:MAG: NADH-quinone oxidoreductase subunit M [Bryobacteraceae bacterium]
MNFLLITLALPLAGFFAIQLLPQDSKASWPMALLFSAAAFLFSLGLIGPVVSAPTQQSSSIDAVWVDSLNIHFHLAVDGLNLWLILLTTLLLLIGIWVADSLIKERNKNFYGLLLLFEFGLIGVFSAADLFVFYVFWEVALVPMYFMVGGWGGSRRMYAAVKFFVYTFAGSVLMLTGIIYLGTKAGTFDYAQVLAALNSGTVALSAQEQLLLFLAFFAAFAIKVPIFPLHTWLPVTYSEAPATATFLIAAVMSKMGAYGLIRYCLPLFPMGAHRSSGWIAVLAIIGIIYGALLATVQVNLKKLIAYSSVSHLGFIVLGIFSFQQFGADGAVFQMLAHGLSTGALFVLAGYLEKRGQSTAIEDYGGVAVAAPGLATAFMIAMLASIGLPMLCNFIGEYLILQGAAYANFTWAVWAAVGVILSAVYMLWMYQRTFLGKPDAEVSRFADLGAKEWVPVIPMIVMMVWLGCYTLPFLRPISAANQQLLEQSKMNLELRVRNNRPVNPENADGKTVRATQVTAVFVETSHAR